MDLSSNEAACHEAWVDSAYSLFARGQARLSIVDLGGAHDGWNLPDVDLEKLCESILRGLGGDRAKALCAMAEQASPWRAPGAPMIDRGKACVS